MQYHHELARFWLRELDLVDSVGGFVATAICPLLALSTFQSEADHAVSSSASSCCPGLPPSCWARPPLLQPRKFCSATPARSHLVISAALRPARPSSPFSLCSQDSDQADCGDLDLWILYWQAKWASLCHRAWLVNTCASTGAYSFFAARASSFSSVAALFAYSRVVCHRQYRHVQWISL